MFTSTCLLSLLRKILLLEHVILLSKASANKNHFLRLEFVQANSSQNIVVLASLELITSI